MEISRAMKKLFTSQLVICLLLLAYWPTALSTELQTRRFSIAISGGASKGAYEAGLNWGLLKILRDIENIDPNLLGQSYGFTAASFSGASAGGINTLLSSLSWCSRPESDGGLANNINDNIFRDVWLLPDVNRLLPPTADSPYYSENDALLARYDLLQAAGELRKHWNKAIFRAGCRIPLGVTVTRVLPDELRVGNVEVQNQRMYIPFEAHSKEDGRLSFRFDPGDYPRLSDPAMILMPRSQDSPAYSIDDQRIEDTALTSAAFPGGFGRKRLQYCRLNSYVSINETKPVRQESELATSVGIICPEGYELTEAEFADGGLFDNLPVGLARKLAEQHKLANKNQLPVTYIYLDPNSLRYQIPPPSDLRACNGEKPPKACELMEFSFLTEQSLLLGALGTARKYELYRELTSEHWSLNLSQLSYELAENLSLHFSQLNCKKELAFFEADLSCAESLRRAGALMELAYNRVSLPITYPYSAEKLRTAGIINKCEYSKKKSATQQQSMCSINVKLYRKHLANNLSVIAGSDEQISDEFVQRIQKAKLSIHNDRVLRVTSRGAPITGTLLSSFGAFLDFKFRDYDYYVGVYDAIIAATNTLCGLNFSEQYQNTEFLQCQNSFAQNIYNRIGINKDPRGQYLFARLAKWEFGTKNILSFAYDPLPNEDRDMAIILDGLMKTLNTGKQRGQAKQGLFFTEDTFFLHLNSKKFLPTPTNDGSQPLLAQIIADPTRWTSEMVRRLTTRLVYLEQQAETIYAAREPSPEYREHSQSLLMGIAAHSLQTATYNYPEFDFTPSTAPKNWLWRNVIPYEVGFDIAQSDINFTWQPTWALANKNLIGVRASLGFVGGVIESDGSEVRENYGSLGLGYIHQLESITISSWGVTPAWYHKWKGPAVRKQDTLGVNLHVGFIKDRLRHGIGARDINEISDTYFLTIGLTDLPGLAYWLTR